MVSSHRHDVAFARLVLVGGPRPTLGRTRTNEEEEEDRGGEAHEAFARLGWRFRGGGTGGADNNGVFRTFVSVPGLGNLDSTNDGGAFVS